MDSWTHQSAKANERGRATTPNGVAGEAMTAAERLLTAAVAAGPGSYGNVKMPAAVNVNSGSRTERTVSPPVATCARR